MRRVSYAVADVVVVVVVILMWGQGSCTRQHLDLNRLNNLKLKIVCLLCLCTWPIDSFVVVVVDIIGALVRGLCINIYVIHCTSE